MPRPARKTRTTSTPTRGKPRPATKQPSSLPAAAAPLPTAAATKSKVAPSESKPPSKPPKPAKPATEPKPGDKSRTKLIRDSFTMPREDFDLIAQLKARALDFKRPTKKSELLRAGLQALAAYDDARLQAALQDLRVLKTGRPKKKKH